MNEQDRPLRIGVLGHVEHVTLGRVPIVPRTGDIAHLRSPQWFPGGGGGITFFQLANSANEVHLFTALGDDEAGDAIEAKLAKTGASIHAVRRDAAHTRDIVMIDDSGERTIVVVGAPLHPRADDNLPYEILAGLDAVFFSAQDPALLRLARQARILVATARRKAAIRDSGVRLDVIVGSNHDPRERSTLEDYDLPPGAVVMTEGSEGGVVQTADGIARFTAPPVEDTSGGAYGAGDSFAGALTHFLASGASPLQAATEAARFGGAILSDLNPLEAQAELPNLRRA